MAVESPVSLRMTVGALLLSTLAKPVIALAAAVVAASAAIFAFGPRPAD